MSESLADVLGNDTPLTASKPDAVSQPAGDPIAEPTSVETTEQVETPAESPIDDEFAERDEEGAPPAPGTKVVPLAALEAIRKKGQDWKGQAVETKTRLEERDRENADLRRQLEEARKTVAAPAQVTQVETQTQAVQPQPISPIEDPDGFTRQIEERVAARLWDAQLTWSEARNKAVYPDLQEKVDGFKEAAKLNPQLAADLRKQSDPYAWAYDQGKRFLETRDIMADPAAYRARMEAEIRASLTASAPPPAPAAAAAPAPKPVANLPTSLASSRSAGERTAPAWNGDPPLSDILK